MCNKLIAQVFKKIFFAKEILKIISVAIIDSLIKLALVA
jgi:hypothetical protein